MDKNCISYAGIGPRKIHRKEMKAAHQAKQATVIPKLRISNRCKNYIAMKKRFEVRKHIIFWSKSRL